MNDNPHADIIARLEAITPGEWIADGYDTIHAVTLDNYIYICQTTYDDQYDTLQHSVAADTEFIANAPADMRKLLDDNAKLRAEIVFLNERCDDVTGFYEVTE